MEIKSITLDGFLSYYGETTILFSEGTTVIIGKNNTGKSKLFDAFHYVLFNRVFDSQMEVWIEGTEAVGQTILNKRRKNEAGLKKGQTAASVCLELNSEEFPDDIIYIERKYNYDFSKGSVPRVTVEFSVSLQDALSGNTKSYTGQAADALVLQLFPSCLRDFVLFQGEAASDLMKLSKKNQSTIEKAIRQVARLDLFEKATDIANSYYKTKVNALTRLNSANVKVNAEIKILRDEVQSYEAKKTSSEQRKNQCEEEIDKLQDTVLKQKEELEQQQEFLALFAERQKLIDEQQKVTDQLNRFKDINRPIGDTWVFYKVMDKIRSFSSFYSKLEIIGQVPAPIAQVEIKRSLANHFCSLCGCELHEGSKCYENVKKKVQNDAIDGLGKLMSGLNYTFSNKIDAVERVPNDIQEYTDSRKRVEDARKVYRQKLDELTNKIKSTEVSSDDVKKKKDLEIKRQLYITNEAKLKRLNTDLAKASSSVEVYQREIDERNSKIMALMKQTGDVPEVDKAKVYYSKKISECMNKLCAVAQNLAYTEVQSTSNDLYHDMMKENPAIVGDIRIDRQNSEIYTVNSLGEKITNLNTGSRITIQLAVISGILSVAASQFSSFFPFITDAPTSSLDNTNKMQVIKCMIRAFEQSIIIVKDDAEKPEGDPLRQLVMESDDIGAAYELSLHLDEGCSSIDDQYTVVNAIKEE